jgi:hypothetical protein
MATRITDPAPPRTTRNPGNPGNPPGVSRGNPPGVTRGGQPGPAGADSRPRPAAPYRGKAGPRLVSAPRPAPKPAAPPRPAPGPSARTGPAESAGRHRMPFLLLIVGMLCGALVCLLVISTTLAAGSFQITSLQQQNQAMAKQQQQLQQEVAQDQAPSVIAQRAEQLGMQPAGQLQFLNVKTGQISSDAATGAGATIQVPGYTP